MKKYYYPALDGNDYKVGEITAEEVLDIAFASDEYPYDYNGNLLCPQVFASKQQCEREIEQIRETLDFKLLRLKTQKKHFYARRCGSANPYFKRMCRDGKWEKESTKYLMETYGLDFDGAAEKIIDHIKICFDRFDDCVIEVLELETDKKIATITEKEVRYEN